MISITINIDHLKLKFNIKNLIIKKKMNDDPKIYEKEN